MIFFAVTFQFLLPASLDMHTDCEAGVMKKSLSKILNRTSDAPKLFFCTCCNGVWTLFSGVYLLNFLT
jgi:hypothetical protein